MYRTASTTRVSDEYYMSAGQVAGLRSAAGLDHLPMYGPQMEIAKKEAARLRFAENMTSPCHATKAGGSDRWHLAAIDSEQVLPQSKADGEMRSPPAMTRGGGGEGLRQHYLQNMHDHQLQARQKYYSLNCPEAHCNDLNSKGSGVCMMSTAWKEEQHPSFIIFISSFLHTNSYRLNFLQIAPDFIFNNGGTSVAFLFITNWDCHDASSVFSRVVTLKRQFRHLYVVVFVPTKEQNDSFNDSYFKHAMELGNPTFVPVCDPEMGFEKIVKIAHARGVCKQQDVISMMKLERMQSIEQMDCFHRVITAIPGIDNHDANALAGAVGSIEAISRASKEFILENTDLSVDKAERIFRFFRDPSYYLGPKIN